MAMGTVNRICKLGFLFTLMCTYLTSTSSVSLDLTELRNKISKIKLNPRGNLWATGHFMGKKSIVEDAADGLGADADPDTDPDLRELIAEEVLRTALQAQLRDAQSPEQDADLFLRLLRGYTGRSTK
ncbi:neuromedin Ba [Denticeps clupeoides]|uniref:Uncharacterized protein n=1 Tax=Denticeps clupeoides TaxID=299321 RepID=A0AAY4C517_9TELE|nr:neuromedin-B-like [Denticeps clupeoides]